MEYNPDSLHPIWSTHIAAYRDADGENIVLHLDDPEQWKKASDMVKAEMDAADSVLAFLELINEPYWFMFLEQTYERMSIDDMTDVLSKVWNAREYNADIHGRDKKEIKNIFATCNKERFMSEEERKVFEELPDEITVYRGLNNTNTRLVRAFSWTLDQKIVSGLSPRPDRFFGDSGFAYRAKIKKKDVYAYIQTAQEVVVNPDKLYDIETYSAIRSN